MSDWEFLNKHRVRNGPLASNDAYGFNGAFHFALPGEARAVFCLASDCSYTPPHWPKWQHVSVSFGSRSPKTPSWELMCQIKDLFWDPDDIVIQLHPPRSQWINNHPGCLHLWRCIQPGVEQPMPPGFYVGLQQPAPK